MIPLEITHSALVTNEVLNAIRDVNSDFSEILIDLLLFFKSTYRDVFRMPDPPLHDPCAVAFVVDSSIFETRLMRVDIEMVQ
jgi:inosine-uridine nucleoside N-ribohydrolase